MGQFPREGAAANTHSRGRGVKQQAAQCLFNLYAEYIMRNAGLEEAQAVFKIAERNINSLRYADDTTLMAESEECSRCLVTGRIERYKDPGHLPAPLSLKRSPAGMGRGCVLKFRLQRTDLRRGVAWLHADS